jgi:hypothetical protein
VYVRSGDRDVLHEFRAATRTYVHGKRSDGTDRVPLLPCMDQVMSRRGSPGSPDFRPAGRSVSSLRAERRDGARTSRVVGS